MSQPEQREPERDDGSDASEGDGDREGETEEPAIEADLVREELRIDGICGVY